MCAAMQVHHSRTNVLIQEANGGIFGVKPGVTQGVYIKDIQ